VLILQGMADAEIDQARLFAPGDHLHGVAQCRLRPGDEVGGVVGPAQGVGGHHPHVLRREVAQPLTQAFQTGQRALGDGLDQVVVGVQAFGQTHHLLDLVHHLDAALIALYHQQMEAVGAQVQRRQLCGGGSPDWRRWFGHAPEADRKAAF